MGFGYGGCDDGCGGGLGNMSFIIFLILILLLCGGSFGVCRSED
ncbi:hypothetical protein [Desulforamulus ruminis]|nr:hypothetical protein [Desulforamulus ruminis]